MKKNSKKVLSIIVLLILVGVVSITYAYFSTGGTQSLANTFTSGCLNITIESESAAINLANQIPITDVKGLSTTPYTFTVKNTCEEATNYQVNLESLNETTNTLGADYIKVSLASDTNDNIISILSQNEITKNYIEGSYISHNLYIGTIEGKDTKEFSLRLWLDYDATKEQAASKTYTSKINVIANPNLEVDKSEIKYTLASTTLTGTLSSEITSASYCVTKTNECVPNIETPIENNKITIELEESKEEQVVCTLLNNNKTICSKPLIVTAADLNILAMYQENDSGEYEEVEIMPSSGYIINQEQSYCLVNGEKDENAILETYNGRHTIANLQKGSNCYIYFEKQTAKDFILANISTITSRTSFNAVYTETTTNTLFTAEDDDGTSYYYAGAATDNYVYFAGYYWRIIRINGDGSIRLIYQGESATATGINAQIGTSKFNSSYNDNMYHGYMYTSGSLHGLGTNSTIKGTLDNWFTNLNSYTSYLDYDAGFCGDRTPSTIHTSSNGSGGTGTTITYYGDHTRYLGSSTATPTLKCANSSDLYTTGSSTKGNKALTYPIGLINMNEVWLAGGYQANNISYYLYTGEYYWTMSPSRFDGNYAHVFRVDSSGIHNYDNVNDTYGVRPVINLRSDVTLIGIGTSTAPYEIVLNY